ncbi:MAG: hypothetical protein CL862_03630 [Cyanobium sp. NAT70]|nr:hypothetical protein [Cyanobium sp. NAT70]
METPQQRWETRVIHLNLNNKPASEPKQQPQVEQPPADPQKPIFSDAYLKEEFPNHYTEQGELKKPEPPSPPKPQHPATQLQSFMNKLGSEGWEFVGVYPVGQLTMMMFRRPLPPVPVEVPPAQPISAESSPDVAVHAVLQQILQRLELLEQRSVAPSPPSLLPPTSSGVSVMVLSSEQLQVLAPSEALPAAKAALALGLRSPASLLNYGARHGYPIGLVKVAANGQAAIYRGEAQRLSGGKAVRLWSIVPQSQLPRP